MSYVIYLRKSRADMEAEARGEGETLARHERALLALARAQKLDISEIYREIVSGDTIADRPVMQRLLREVQEGLWEGVLVMEVERLARGDTMDQGLVAQAFAVSDTLIVTPAKTYDPNNEFDQEYFEFGLFMSRREYKAINRRLQRGRLAAVQEGKYLGSIPPYGYVRQKLEHDSGYTLAPHLEQAEIVRLIFDLYTNGEEMPDGRRRQLGTSRIARKLNDLRVPTVKGGVWTFATVRDILQNPVYIGKIRWNWRKTAKTIEDGQVKKSRPHADAADCVLVDGLHEAIIDTATWERAQRVMRESPAAPGRGETVKNPLAGLVVCGLCGKKMVRRAGSGGTADMLVCAEPQCCNAGSALWRVEDTILEALRDWLKDKKIELRDAPGQRKQGALLRLKQNALSSANQELQDLKKQSGQVHDLLEQGVYSVETFLERSRDIAGRMEAAQRQMAVLQDEISAAHRQNDERAALLPEIKNVLDIYDTLDDPHQKNQLLKRVLHHAAYTREAGGRWKDPYNFSLVIYPLLRRD